MGDSRSDCCIEGAVDDDSRLEVFESLGVAAVEISSGGLEGWNRSAMAGSSSRYQLAGMAAARFACIPCLGVYRLYRYVRIPRRLFLAYKKSKSSCKYRQTCA